MTNRKINIEFIRVFAIFMTVMIHVSNIYINNFQKIAIHSFDTAIVYNSMSRICVPLFFMVSGIFLINQDYTFKKYIQRILKFILLLAFWSAVYFFLNNDEYRNITGVIANSILNANQTSRHLWFMYAIIGIYIALPFIRCMCKNMTREQENLFLILWLFFSGFDVIYVPLARFLTNSNVDITYPIPIINAAYYLGYFIGGHILYERFKKTKGDKKKNLLCILCYILPTLVTILVTCFFSVQTDSVYDPMMWYRSVFTAIASFAVFVLVIINGENIKSRFIFNVSKHSFGIYLIHMIFLNLLTENCNIIEFNPILAIPVITLGVYLISLICCFIISKIPLFNKLI